MEKFSFTMSKMQCGSERVSTANRHFKNLKATVSEDLQMGTGKMGMRRNLLWKTHRYYSISYGPWSEPFWCILCRPDFAMVETGFTKSEKLRKHSDEEHDGFRARLYFLLYHRICADVPEEAMLLSEPPVFNPKSLADADGMFNGLPIGVFMIFQTVFCATSATIVSGAMAERTKFISYLIYSAAISVFIYPITRTLDLGRRLVKARSGSMILQDLPQFIWSAVCVRLAGAKWSDLVSENTQKRENRLLFLVSNLPLGALGVFILWFCWFGFNCGSTTAATYNLGDIAMTTNLAAAAAATLVTLIIYLGTLWKTGYQV